jgi:hypothetical protein
MCNFLSSSHAASPPPLLFHCSSFTAWPDLSKSKLRRHAYGGRRRRREEERHNMSELSRSFTRRLSLRSQNQSVWDARTAGGGAAARTVCRRRRSGEARCPGAAPRWTAHERSRWTPGASSARARQRAQPILMMLRWFCLHFFFPSAPGLFPRVLLDSFSWEMQIWPRSSRYCCQNHDCSWPYVGGPGCGIMDRVVLA